MRALQAQQGAHAGPGPGLQGPERPGVAALEQGRADAEEDEGTQHPATGAGGVGGR
ncbi:hypothetical protein [Kitasatospora paranensis]|uniref:hypothetical protein n=1 Tax=Kitasatospora paranensis TaxID=258053 RepID=UPI0031E5E591